MTRSNQRTVRTAKFAVADYFSEVNIGATNYPSLLNERLSINNNLKVAFLLYGLFQLTTEAIRISLVVLHIE